MLKKFLLILFLVIFQTVLLHSHTLADQSNIKKEVKIAWIGPLTGDSAFLGQDSVKVLKQQIEKLNSINTGFNFKLLVEDDQYSTAKAISAYRKFRSHDHAQIFIILTYGAIVPISNLAKNDDVVIFDTLDCDSEIAGLSENVFCLAKNTENIGETLADLAIKNGVKNPTFIYSQFDPFMPKVINAAMQKFKSQNGNNSEVEVVSKLQSFGLNEKVLDFKTYLIKAKKNNADALFILGYDDYALAFKQARELGIKVSFYTLVSSLSTPTFKKLTGNSLEGTYAVGWHAPRTKELQDFNKEFKERYEREPMLEISTIPSFDLIHILNKIITQNNSEILTNEKTFIKNLEKEYYQIKNYQGLSGNISVDSDGGVSSFPISKVCFSGGEIREIITKQ